MRRCGRCGFTKSNQSFAFKNKRAGKLHSLCRNCQSEYRREHYQANRRTYIEKARRWNDQQRTNLERFLGTWLSEHPCVDCGIEDILVLEFDHTSDKTLEISKMFRYRYSIEAVQKEIEKCVVRCANCHRKKTAKERNDWRFRYSQGSIV